MVFVTSDPHGHRDQLVETLQAAGLIDEAASWSGGDATLWVLGDLMDRGPDGIGTVDLVMRLQQEAADAGGEVGVVLGNHEVLALGMHRFSPQAPDGDNRVLSYILSWEANGGHDSDQAALTDEHIAWMSDLPAMVDHDGHLLMHSDTDAYLEFGDSIETINAAVTAALKSEDIDLWWEMLHRLTTRHVFARDGGKERAEAMASQLGVRRIVHGHSIIGDLRGIDPADVDAPLLYCERQVLAIDGGMYAGGPCLVVNLAGWD
jgi:hypothetical protein